MKSFILISLLGFAQFGFADRKGNGGDMCEDRFKIVRDDIQGWVANDGGKGLKLTSPLKDEDYKSAMLLVTGGSTVNCTDEVLKVGNAEKTCKNFVDADGLSKISCNSQRFMNTSESDQYVLVHHEYAGLAKIEINDGESSDYSISNQITGFLEDQIIKKLVVKPSPSTEGEKLSVSTISRGSQFKAMKDILLQANTEFTNFQSGHIFCNLHYKKDQSTHQIRKGAQLTVDFTENVTPRGYLVDSTYAKIHFVAPFQGVDMRCFVGLYNDGQIYAVPNIFDMKQALLENFNFTPAVPTDFP